jgi:hypothetical protein
VKIATRALLLAGAVRVRVARAALAGRGGRVRHGSFASRLLGPLAGLAGAV